MKLICCVFSFKYTQWSAFKVVQSQTLFWPYGAAGREVPEEFACACVNYHHIYVEVARSLSSVYYAGKSAMSKQNSETRVVFTAKKFLHIFGRNFVDAVKYAMEMCKYNFVPTFEQLQVIYYLCRGKDVFVVALHAPSIMFAMLCDHHLTTMPVICCCFDFTTDFPHRWSHG